MQLAYITPNHPQANGLVERMHRTMKGVLRQLVEGCPLRWPQFVEECQRVFNNAVHVSTGVTHFYAFFRRHPPRRMTVPLTTGAAAEEVMNIAEMVRDESRLSQQRYFEIANHRRRDKQVPVDAFVWV